MSNSGKTSRRDALKVLGMTGSAGLLGLPDNAEAASKEYEMPSYAKGILFQTNS